MGGSKGGGGLGSIFKRRTKDDPIFGLDVSALTSGPLASLKSFTGVNLFQSFSRPPARPSQNGSFTSLRRESVSYAAAAKAAAVHGPGSNASATSPAPSTLSTVFSPAERSSAPVFSPGPAPASTAARSQAGHAAQAAAAAAGASCTHAPCTCSLVQDAVARFKAILRLTEFQASSLLLADDFRRFYDPEYAQAPPAISSAAVTDPTAIAGATAAAGGSKNADGASAYSSVPSLPVVPEATAAAEDAAGLGGQQGGQAQVQDARSLIMRLEQATKQAQGTTAAAAGINAAHKALGVPASPLQVHISAAHRPQPAAAASSLPTSPLPSARRRLPLSQEPYSSAPAPLAPTAPSPLKGGGPRYQQQQQARSNSAKRSNLPQAPHLQQQQHQPQQQQQQSRGPPSLSRHSVPSLHARSRGGPDQGITPRGTRPASAAVIGAGPDQGITPRGPRPASAAPAVVSVDQGVTPRRGKAAVGSDQGATPRRAKGAAAATGADTTPAVAASTGSAGASSTNVNSRSSASMPLLKLNLSSLSKGAVGVGMTLGKSPRGRGSGLARITDDLDSGAGDQTARHRVCY